MEPSDQARDAAGPGPSPILSADERRRLARHLGWLLARRWVGSQCRGEARMESPSGPGRPEGGARGPDPDRVFPAADPEESPARQPRGV